jgi:DnaA family protein
MPQLPLTLVPPRPRRFDNFVAGPNRALVAALRHGIGEGQWLFLRGSPGSGKSHLAHAALQDRREAGESACFVPGRDAAARPLLERADAALAVVDDVDRLAGDPEAEHALFNALNRWRAARASVLLTGRAIAAFELPDLASRLGQTTRLALEALDDAGIAALVDRLIVEFGLVAGRGLRGYVLRHGPRAPAALVELFEAIGRRAHAERRVASVPLAREELDRLARR